jgi:hypothetical protein
VESFCERIPRWSVKVGKAVKWKIPKELMEARVECVENSREVKFYDERWVVIIQR